jgi:hypothetical protein
MYDVTNESWECLSSKYSSQTQPPPLSYHTMTAYGKSVYLFGGCTIDKGRTNELWAYDVESHKWELLSSCQSEAEMENIPSPRGGSSLVAVNDNELHVLFGYNGKQELSDHFAFHRGTQEWRSVVNKDNNLVPPPRSVTNAVFLPGMGESGSIYAVRITCLYCLISKLFLYV